MSVITAIDPGRSEHLPETAASIDALREQISLEWVVAWDGEPTLEVDADKQIVGRSNSGVSCTRNLALAYVRGWAITVIDADDILVTDGVLAGVNALRTDPELGWVGLSRVLIDGTATAHTTARACTFAPGALAEAWTAPFPFHPNSIVIRADLLRRVGGWPAIVCNEDLGMILAASEHMKGRVLPQVLTRYRAWGKQEVARLDYPTMKQLAFSYIETSVNQLRRDGRRTAISAPRSPGGAIGTQPAEGKVR